jgi:predicted DNA-binding transcriptional regulator AlpA
VTKPITIAKKVADKAAAKKASKPAVLLTRKQILERVPLSYPAIWKRMVEGTFPRSHDMGNGKPGWFEHELDAWMASLPVVPLKGDDEDEAA